MIDDTMDLFLRISMHRMVDNFLPKLLKCLAVLNTHQLWDHDVHEANSVGGILLHICEHLRRHTASYKKMSMPSTKGIEDYFPDMRLSPEELVVKVEESFTVWEKAMQDLITLKSGTADLHRIYHLVEHTSYHLGQVVDRVQRKTGKSFQFVQRGLNEQGLRATIEE